VTGVVVLAGSQLLYVGGAYEDYAPALHETALSTVTGQPLTAHGDLARILEVLLAVYSVAVFATLAGALGAYFLDDRHRPGAPPEVSAAAASNRRAAGTGTA
jgi:voltage-gated potassium channel